MSLAERPRHTCADLASRFQRPVAVDLLLTIWGVWVRRHAHLRNTAASLTVQAGYPPKMLQEVMGHASITTTLDRTGTSTPVT